MHTSIHYMTFLNNKYTKIYYQIINRAQTRPHIGYMEQHHIIPNSFFINSKKKNSWIEGDPNAASNLVMLTAREHFVCHLLLVRMISGVGKYKMALALKRFMYAKNHTAHISARDYEYIKRTVSEQMKGRPCSPETREKIRQANLNRLPPSADTRAKLSAAAKRRKGYTAEGLKSVQESNRNRVWTEESKQKLRDFNTGKTNVSQKGIPQEKLTCPHCQLTGGKSAMKHWHFDRCRVREHEQYTNVIS